MNSNGGPPRPGSARASVFVGLLAVATMPVAVLATRWPLRDDDAAFVMDRFYRALATGIGAAPSLRTMSSGGRPIRTHSRFMA